MKGLHIIHSLQRGPKPFILWRPSILRTSPFSNFVRSSKYIYLHYLLCAHSSYLCYIEWIIHRYQKFTFHNYFQKFKKKFQIYYLVKVMYLLIRCYETSFFLWNTNIVILIEVVSNKEKNTPNTSWKITLERVSMKVSDTPPPPLFLTTLSNLAQHSLSAV